MAILYNLTKEYEKSETIYLELLEIRKQNVGETHPLYLEIKEKLEEVQQKMAE